MNASASLGSMADYAPLVLAISVVLFVHMVPTWLAVIVPGWAGWRVFGADRWLCRRVLAGWLVFGAIGYAVLFAYYAVFGIPPLASSIYNHSLHGAFFGAGYGGLAALFYFRRHKSNPVPPRKQI
jgi:hypothetical protein